MTRATDNATINSATGDDTTTDVLVIGSGVAGLSAALAATPARVTVVSKLHFGSGNSAYAQGGIAVALAADDSPALHARDTLAVGGGLNDEEAVRILTTEGPDRAGRLVELGAAFNRTPDGTFDLAREAAHSVRRVLHAADATGTAMLDTLRLAVHRNPAISIEEHRTVVELHVDGGRVCGASIVDRDGRVRRYAAGAVVLATGGSGRLFEMTTNPPEASADGLSLAARAGATLRDLEFVQFHPTALAAAGVDPLPLLTEALRGDGAVLVDETGRRIATDWHPAGDLAPRDIVARGIATHHLAGHDVFLDITAVGDRFADRFPTAVAACRAHCIDLRTGRLPVSPAAHYHMGGVATTLDGRTDVAGLFAAGEVAATGVHGANRLASNSLLEALVFGARAGAAAAADSEVPRRFPGCTGGAVGAVVTDPGRSRTVAAIVRPLMWRKVGLMRDQAGLTEAVQRLDDLDARGLDPETGNLLLAARLVAHAALARTESRGAHHRLDFPMTLPEWSRHIDIRLVNGQIVLSSSPLAAPLAMAQ